MDLESLKAFFLWCLVINFSVLFLWFLALVLGRDWMHRLHGTWFPMSKENFVVSHYLLYGAYKLAILLFNVAPYLALVILT